MKSKAIAFLAAVSLIAVLEAAPEEKKTPLIHTLVIREQWVPDYVVNKMGFMVPSAPKPFEVPPENLAIHDSKTYALVDNRLNIIGPAKKVDADKISLGVLEKKPEDNAPGKNAAPSKGGDTAAKDKHAFKPLFSLALPALNNLVCIYPKPKNDWRAINHLVVGLNGIKPEDNKLLIINVSSYPVTIRSGDAKPTSIQPAAYTFITRRAQGENKVRIQAAALMSGQQKLAANTTVTIASDKLPVLTFLNADPDSGNCGVDFLKDSIDYPPPPEPADRTVAAK